MNIYECAKLYIPLSPEFAKEQSNKDANVPPPPPSSSAPNKHNPSDTTQLHVIIAK